MKNPLVKATTSIQQAKYAVQHEVSALLKVVPLPKNTIQQLQLVVSMLNDSENIIENIQAVKIFDKD